MPFSKGQSGNPRGRPPKPRALTEALRLAGSKTVETDGDKISRNRLLARLRWQAATEGKVTFPDGREMVLEPKDWLAAAAFPFDQIDGPPKQQIEHTGKDDGPIEFIEVARQIAAGIPDE